MSQHPDTEAAEKYADSMTLGPKNAHTKPWARARADGFRAGATHVRASLAPELSKVRELVSLERCDCNSEYETTCSRCEALEILSRLMGKGEG